MGWVALKLKKTLILRMICISVARTRMTEANDGRGNGTDNPFWCQPGVAACEERRASAFTSVSPPPGFSFLCFASPPLSRRAALCSTSGTFARGAPLFPGCSVGSWKICGVIKRRSCKRQMHNRWGKMGCVDVFNLCVAELRPDGDSRSCNPSPGLKLQRVWRV